MALKKAVSVAFGVLSAGGPLSWSHHGPTTSRPESGGVRLPDTATDGGSATAAPLPAP